MIWKNADKRSQSVFRVLYAFCTETSSRRNWKLGSIKMEWSTFIVPKFWRIIWTTDKTVSKCASSALCLRYRNDFSQELHYAYKTKYLSKWLFHLWFCLSMSISVKNLDSCAYKASPVISYTRDLVANSISSTWNVHKLIYLTRQGAHIPAHSVGPRRLVFKKNTCFYVFW